jgi:hypothetical protein
MWATHCINCSVLSCVEAVDCTCTSHTGTCPQHISWLSGRTLHNCLQGTRFTSDGLFRIGYGVAGARAALLVAADESCSMIGCWLLAAGCSVVCVLQCYVHPTLLDVCARMPPCAAAFPQVVPAWFEGTLMLFLFAQVLPAPPPRLVCSVLLLLAATLTRTAASPGGSSSAGRCAWQTQQQTEQTSASTGERGTRCR